jgi:hypothetical protein
LQLVLSAFFIYSFFREYYTRIFKSQPVEEDQACLSQEVTSKIWGLQKEEGNSPIHFADQQTIARFEMA